MPDHHAPRQVQHGQRLRIAGEKKAGAIQQAADGRDRPGPDASLQESSEQERRRQHHHVDGRHERSLRPGPAELLFERRHVHAPRVVGTERDVQQPAADKGGPAGWHRSIYRFLMRHVCRKDGSRCAFSSSWIVSRCGQGMTCLYFVSDKSVANSCVYYLFVPGSQEGSMRKLRVWAACGLLSVGIGLLSIGLMAQSFQGGLRGVVKDPQGVIPGATVTLVNDQNGVSRETVTNGVGEYSFPAIEPALYTVRAVGAGIQDLRAQGRPHRHAGVPRARHPARSRRPRGNDHRDR